jgi:hypothetical protein
VHITDKQQSVKTTWWSEGQQLTLSVRHGWPSAQQRGASGLPLANDVLRRLCRAKMTKFFFLAGNADTQNPLSTFSIFFNFLASFQLFCHVFKYFVQEQQLFPSFQHFFCLFKYFLTFCAVFACFEKFLQLLQHFSRQESFLYFH